MPDEENQKPRFLWDYLRGGRGKTLFSPLSRVINRNSPENLQKKLTALQLQQEIARQKKLTEQEKRVNF
jgi:hypothetical protein